MQEFECLIENTAIHGQFGSLIQPLYNWGKAVLLVQSVLSIVALIAEELSDTGRYTLFACVSWS